MGRKIWCCFCTPTLNDEENARPQVKQVRSLTNEENSEEEEVNLSTLLEVKDVNRLDEVISFIEGRLNARLTDKPEESTSGAESNATSDGVASSIKCGYHFLRNVLKRSHKHVSEILSGDTRKVVIEILKGIAETHWVVAGLGIVAFVWDQLDKISTNRSECIRLLRYMCGLAKQIKQLDHQLEQKKLTDVVVFIAKGSFFCISQMKDSKLSRFFSTAVDTEQLKNLQSELAHIYPDLTMDVTIKLLNRTRTTLRPTQGVNPNAVGIDEARAKVIELLELEDQSSRRGVVLYGVGGIGKTTLATAVFSSLDLKAYKHCRINIDQDPSKFDAKQLQEQILKDLFAKNINLRDSEEGKIELCKLFKEAIAQPVFLFIDNGLRGSDLAKLLPEDLSCLPNGSRILITTRNLDETEMIENGPGGVKCYVYNVRPLSNAASKKLLCWKALGGADKDFDKSLDIDVLVKICGGVPLVLEYAGSKLRNLGNNSRACEDTIEFLKDTLVKGEGKLIEKVVDVVYKSLQEDLYRDAFLDIATFFNNWDHRIVSYIVGGVAFQAIQKAALVRISEEEKVVVHDIVLARGRKLSEVDRITDHRSYKRALQKTERLEKLKGIRLPAPVGSDEFQLHAEHLVMMKEYVRVLHLAERNKLHGESMETFPNLRLLQIRELTNLEKLAVLQAYLDSPELNRLPENSGNLSSLKMLDLTESKLNCLPNCFGRLSCLEVLNISKCQELVSLPQSFSQLSCLKELNISHCVQLSRLPEGFGQLKSLTYLNMAGCSNLKVVSDDFKQLRSLCAVDSSSCPRLDGNAMEKFVEIKSLLLLNIRESPKLINRWKEVKERHPLIVLEMTTHDAFRRSHEHSVSSALLHEQSRFLRNDGNVQFPECSQVAFVLSMCDLSSPSKKAVLETVKEKIAELACGGFQIVHVRVGQIWNQNLQSISNSLVRLPSGTCEWIAPEEKWNKLAGYSIYQLSNGGGRVVSSLHTLIASARVSINEVREMYMEDIKLAFPVSGDVEQLEDMDGGFGRLFFSSFKFEM